MPAISDMNEIPETTNSYSPNISNDSIDSSPQKIYNASHSRSKSLDKSKKDLDKSRNTSTITINNISQRLKYNNTRDYNYIIEELQKNLKKQDERYNKLYTEHIQLKNSNKLLMKNNHNIQLTFDILNSSKIDLQKENKRLNHLIQTFEFKANKYDELEIFTKSYEENMKTMTSNQNILQFELELAQNKIHEYEKEIDILKRCHSIQK